MGSVDMERRIRELEKKVDALMTVTHEDVDKLRSFARGSEYSGEDEAHAESLADRIEAFLPPEGT